jgi:hypothetical protein
MRRIARSSQQRRAVRRAVSGSSEPQETRLGTIGIVAQPGDGADVVNVLAAALRLPPHAPPSELMALLREIDIGPMWFAGRPSSRGGPC